MIGRIPNRIHVTDRRYGADVTVTFVLRDGVLLVSNVDTSHAGLTPGETSRLLERLPITRYRNEAAANAIVMSTRGEQESVKVRLRNPVEAAAQTYREHNGSTPMRHVADTLGIPYETARSRIRAARKRGLLA